MSSHNKSHRDHIKWLEATFPAYQQLGAVAYKPNLDRIAFLCEWLGNPQKKLRCIHIAGTNGKGTVTAMLASTYTEAGENVGMFTSPHILDFSERIRVNGQVISSDFINGFVERIRQLESDDPPSFFEVSFAMALDYFRHKGCTLCVIETGMGGRLDATNIIVPILSVITNIALDHTAILGGSLPEIAFEKAGIMKSGVPVVIGSKQSEILHVFEKAAAQCGVDLLFAQDNYELQESFEFPLLGAHQAENARTAWSAVKVLKELGIGATETHFQRALNKLAENTGYMARMQVVEQSPLIVVDGAHNTAGVQTALQAIHTVRTGRLFLIYGSSSDKDITNLVALFPKDVHLVLSCFKSPRTMTRNQLESIAQGMPQSALVFEEVSLAYTHTRNQMSNEDTLLIFGSFFLIADFFQFLASNTCEN
jgi:dihydrofolate synthase/folylpolyglutamate synthase